MGDFSSSFVCRVCNGSMFTDALLRYENMPATAQGFPTLETLDQDSGACLEAWQCSICGLVQLSNEPVSYYKDVIRAAAFSEEMRQFRVEQFADWFRKYELYDKKILEVGCGRGEYLKLVHDAGALAYGIEHSKDSVLDCRANGLNVVEGFLDENMDLSPYAPFDAFICLNFMEHWPEPGKVLRNIGSNLAEGAIGLVEVPNFDMIVEKGLFSEFIADHLLYFTKDTLVFALQKNGFEVLECRPVWKDYIISAIVCKRRSTDLNFFQQYLSRISKELNDYIDRFSQRKVAIWGAGHQALAVIALARLEGKVGYVVDSAIFKQGKFTPATHLPIVSPEHLEKEPVEAVIVMAASYSDEVARNFRLKFGTSINVAVLRDYGLELYE